ncbi:MAG: helix-turn-helix domain-containing protein [Thiobacillus sp.]|nr:helix-turn-helix domain-containing protein [Thiobacillus sp.]
MRLPRSFTLVRHRVPIPILRRRLERTREPVDEIGWRVGHEDPAYFRLLFKRITGGSPASYRRPFQIPRFASGSPRRR